RSTPPARSPPPARRSRPARRRPAPAPRGRTMASPPPAVRYAAAPLRAFTADVLRAVGLPAEDAARVAHLMVGADLSGQDAHGIFRLPQYVGRIRNGRINLRPSLRVEQTP